MVTGMSRRAAAASTLEKTADGLSDAKAIGGALCNELIEDAPGFVSHPEPSGADGLIDILGRGADQTDFEIVNHGGTVGRDG
jgi:hypothetical protein